eukprot:TRINITY_DN5357_c0_g1_i1.p1 TRINITY_DN5357_c0_g1~~TRINITY_DN5357_c0_g1_i1.p1  ORF type:complete len:158 (-),score=9.61 TRINITY_DN5357_c0_g1_i1:27-440(-)
MGTKILWIVAICLVVIQAKQCNFECPEGTTKTINPNHKPTYNGCGSGGLRIQDNFGFTSTCNTHDMCYDTCGNLKSDCDETFLTDMLQICASQIPSARSECQSTAKMFHLATQGFGCQTYKKSQSKACNCLSEKNDL